MSTFETHRKETETFETSKYCTKSIVKLKLIFQLSITFFPGGGRAEGKVCFRFDYKIIYLDENLDDVIRPQFIKVS